MKTGPYVYHEFGELRIEMLPGPHVIEAQFEMGMLRSKRNETVSFEVRAGARYQLEGVLPDYPDVNHWRLHLRELRRVP